MKFLFFILLPFTIFSQNSVLKIDYSFRDHNQATIPSSLYIKNNEAVFKVYDTRETGIVDTPTGDVYHVENDPLARFCYSNNEKVYYRCVAQRQELVYSDEYQYKTNWTINSNNKKKIGKYNCTEAKLRLNGRNYTAWFTYEIPVKFGPMKLHNLPGLIVEVSDDMDHCFIKLDKISKTNDDSEITKHKNYVLNKKTKYDYNDYERVLVEIEVNNKIRWISEIKRMHIEEKSTSTTFVDDAMSNALEVKKLLDVPPYLINELKKYQYN